MVNRCPSNNIGWKKKFFHVSTLGFCEENPTGHPLPTNWVSELNGKALSFYLCICILNPSVLTDSFFEAGSIDLLSILDECQGRIRRLA